MIRQQSALGGILDRGSKIKIIDYLYLQDSLFLLSVNYKLLLMERILFLTIVEPIKPVDIQELLQSKVNLKATFVS